MRLPHFGPLSAGFTDKPRTHVSRKENTMSRTAYAITGACHSPVALLTPAVRAVKRLRRSSLLLAALLTGICQASLGQDYILEAPGSAPPAAAISGGATLFQNVRIFDGKSAALSAPSNVLVRGNTIERISASPITVDANADVRVIAGNGRVLMPGLIDAHWHSFMAATPMPLLMTANPSYLHLLAARQAEATLMRGFTTVRDLGGPVFGLKRAIDEGVMIGPRIYPSGAMISQTSGHGDFRFLLRGSADAGRSAEPLRGRGRRSHCRQPR